MLLETLKKLFKRDLTRLIQEIELYTHEADLWKTKHQIKNSAGNLCLHLVGNLNTYIGKELGGTNYVRNRDLEFSLKNIPQKDLLKMIEDTMAVVDQTLVKLDETTLENQYPILVFEQPTSISYLLIHLTTHLTYHLGQINYHRRLVVE